MNLLGLIAEAEYDTGDVAAAVVRALEDTGTRGKVYELGGPGTYTFRALMEFILRETDRRRLLLSVPFGLARVQSLFLQFLPSPLLTPDQVKCKLLASAHAAVNPDSTLAYSIFQQGAGLVNAYDAHQESQREE